MHTDENKRFDKRTVENYLRRRIVTKKDYETFLAKLPDVSDKVFNPDEKDSESGEDIEARKVPEVGLKRKGGRIKEKG